MEDGRLQWLEEVDCILASLLDSVIIISEKHLFFHPPLPSANVVILHAYIFSQSI